MVALMTVSQVAKVFALSKAQIYAMSSEGSLPAVRIGASVRFHPDDIERIAREGVPAANDQDE